MENTSENAAYDANVAEVPHEKPKLSKQCDRILSLLENRLNVESNEGWVDLPWIMRLGIACHTRRIHELRKAGYVIEMHEEREGTQRRTAYRLLSGPAQGG
jgi:Helix-turn-helix domain